MALEPYQRRIGVEIPQGTDTRVAQVADVGPAIGNLGKSLLQEAEPYLQERAQNAAIEAVGVANIVKDAEGNFIRPPAPPGGGLVYASVYNQAMDDRYTERVVKDAEDRFAEIAALHPNDPRGYMSMMEAYSVGVLEGVAPRVRAAVDVALSREMSERYRGANAQYLARQEQAAVNGLNLTFRTRYETGVQILTTGDPLNPDTLKRAAIEFNEGDKAIAQLVAIGEVSETGANAYRQANRNAIDQAGNVFLSRKFLQEFGTSMPNLSNEDLRTLENWGMGVGDDRTVQGMTFQQFNELVPDEQIRGIVGRSSGNALGDRVAAENEARRHSDAEASTAAAKAMAAEIRRNNPISNLTGAQQDAVEIMINERGPIMQQMASETGRAQIMADLASYGYMTNGVKSYLEDAILGPQLDNIAEFVLTMQNEVRTNGVWTGQRLYEQLSEDARTTLEFDQVLRTAGFTPAERQSRILQLRRKDIPTMEAVQEAFAAGRRGQVSFPEQVNNALATALGITPQQAAVSGAAHRDFEYLLRLNMRLHEGSIDRALAATSQSVANAYVKAESYFVGGVGPKELVTSGFTSQELSTALLGDRTKNPARATFSGENGNYARLRPISDNPQAGFGIYEVQMFNRNRQPIGSYLVDVDKALEPLKTVAQQRKDADTAAAMERAREARRIQNEQIELQRQPGFTVGVP